MFSQFPNSLEDFTTTVVPILQQRGIFRTEYEGTTLRENLGLSKVENRYNRNELKYKYRTGGADSPVHFLVNW